MPITPPARPNNRDTARPHTKKVIPKIARKFDSDTSIFEVDREDNKQHGTDNKGYHLSISAIRTISIGEIAEGSSTGV